MMAPIRDFMDFNGISYQHLPTINGDVVIFDGMYKQRLGVPTRVSSNLAGEKIPELNAGC